MDEGRVSQSVLKEWGQNKSKHEARMRHVYTLAQESDEREVPVAASLWMFDTLICAHTNQVEQLRDPLAHAEILCARHFIDNNKGKFWDECTLYVTLQPCTLCMEVIKRMRLQMLCFGAFDKDLALGPPPYPGITLPGILEKECSAILLDFFKKRR